MKDCVVDPVIQLRDNCDIGNFVVERYTSSALVKTRRSEMVKIRNKKAIILTPEL